MVYAAMVRVCDEDGYEKEDGYEQKIVQVQIFSKTLFYW